MSNPHLPPHRHANNPPSALMSTLGNPSDCLSFFLEKSANPLLDGSFFNMKNLGNILKQAQKMQGEMAKIQEEMAATSVVGQSGGGMVEVTMDGRQEVKKIRLDPTVVDARDVEMLEDLIVSAFNDAQNKVQAMMQENMTKLTGGLSMPGMNFPL